MEELKKFILKTFKDMLITFIGGLFFVLIGIILLYKKEYLIGCIINIIGLLAVIDSLTTKTREKKVLKELEQNIELSNILKDFNKSKSFSEDTVRLGNEYIFRLKYNNIIKYKDVKRIDYFNRSHMHEPNVGLYLIMNNDKEELLCRVYNEDKKGQIKEIVEYIKTKNNDIEINIDFLK